MSPFFFDWWSEIYEMLGRTIFILGNLKMTVKYFGHQMPKEIFMRYNLIKKIIKIILDTQIFKAANFLIP